ncbi:hypothetical protein HYPSUDRAFT_215982 [Hypholoma sublateritium FD-334 SS-4]|uniref:Peptidase C14 caspase domain-containing protein n=1 Tax=Hypholoma sublateritium (strain FD-334 SS-4) TaxID=945553 RepID=A0A0D2L5S4_HYPSF|nr:hypothetical protein HYPSUDRAFT_215982 [Hypholoma sublateritium FD-334 SS-4]
MATPQGYYGRHSSSNHGSMQSSRLPTYTPTRRQKAPFKLFALTIAINKYLNTHYTPLKGCIADAEDVESYLMNDLLVPSSQIFRLRNEEATRDRILRSLNFFRSNNNIKNGDPILIFFAGHGGETEAPPGWGSKIQMLIPYDCEMPIGTGDCVHGIPDFLFGQHLHEISKVKGNNITVILDNCHSGSGTRDASFLTRGVRYRSGSFPGLVPNRMSVAPPPILEGPSTRIGGLGMISGTNYRNGLLWSSVLLSACKSSELAKEHGGRGLFTTALLQTIRDLKTDIWNITYEELFRNLPEVHLQSPQCEGDHGNRFIFRDEVKPLSVGESSRSALVLPRHLATNVVDLLLYISDESKGQRAISGLVEFQNAKRVDGVKIIRVLDPNTGTPPRFTLVCNEAASRFEIIDTEFKRKCGKPTLPVSLPSRAIPAQFCKVFQAISTYEYYLRHSEAKLDNRISISLQRVAYDVPGGRIVPGILNVNGRIDVTQDHNGSFFVVHIKNDTQHNLYPALFYFDDCDFSISLIYQAPTVSGQQIVDPPLKSNQYISIGYGGLGIQHLVVGVRSHGIEVGSLKVFLSTEHIDFSRIEQQSPFHHNSSRGMKQHILSSRPLIQSTAIPFIARASEPTIRNRGTDTQAGAQSRKTIADGPVFSCEAATARQHIPNVNPADGLEMLMQRMNIQTEPDFDALYEKVMATDREISALSEKVDLLRENQQYDHKVLRDLDACLVGVERAIR